MPQRQPKKNMFHFLVPSLHLKYNSASNLNAETHFCTFLYTMQTKHNAIRNVSMFAKKYIVLLNSIACALAAKQFIFLFSQGHIIMYYALSVLLLFCSKLRHFQSLTVIWLFLWIVMTSRENGLKQRCTMYTVCTYIHLDWMWLTCSLASWNHVFIMSARRVSW